ncbi:endonuclease/exonuclease/phosphatase family protein [Paralcaligenes ginsengisoli]
MTIDNPPFKLKILTVNAHKGFTVFNSRFILHELRDAIRAAGADIVFLQEVLGAHQEHASRLARWPATSQYEFLADSIWPDFAYGRNAVYPYDHYGNALLSKYPITHYDNLNISVGKHEKRGLLHCVVRPVTLDTDIHAICVHLGWREQQRSLQLSDLCRRIDDHVPADAPLLVAGDFNDWRLRGHHLLMRRSGLKEIFNERRGRVARSFPACFPFLRLDRIYVRSITQFEPARQVADPWKQLSNHAPLAAEIEL